MSTRFSGGCLEGNAMCSGSREDRELRELRERGSQEDRERIERGSREDRERIERETKQTDDRINERSVSNHVSSQTLVSNACLKKIDTERSASVYVSS